MSGFLADLFSARDFMPHGHCYLWQTDVLWLHVISDSLIALSYYSIPWAMYVFVRRRHDLPFPWLFGLFATFIFACGTTHAFEVATVWSPVYRISGVFKLATGLVSAVTAGVLWPLLPRALALPSPHALKLEIDERTRAQEELLKSNQTLERRVRERTDELARSNEDLRQLAAVASHDLREPLRTVRSFAKLLQEDHAHALDPEGLSYLTHVVEGAQRMERMIDDLLAYSSAFEAAPSDVDTAQALDDACEALANELSGVTITRDALPHVGFAKGQFVRVLQNLLSNAAKYRAHEPLRVHVGVDATSHPGFLRFYVADNGMGVPEGFETAIFQPFRRLHTDTEIPGSGMGLAICKKIVERQGGNIWVTKNEPHGALFSFTVPASAA
jgi:signal transduction histidine kinase